MIGLTNTSDRLLKAFRMYRAGKARLIVVSGGDNPLLAKARTEHHAEEMRNISEEWGVPDSAILVEDSSINTRENALFTRKLLADEGIQNIILVTSALHMCRAAATFRKVEFNVELFQLLLQRVGINRLRFSIGFQLREPRSTRVTPYTNG